MSEQLQNGSIERRKFLKRALVVAWSTPVIMTIASEHALAQSPACGTRSGGNPCPNSPDCPSSRNFCCTTTNNGSACACYTSGVGLFRCASA